MSESRGDDVSEVRYKAGDVCRMADVQPYVLRYWESEFAVLAPERGASGPRLYTARDVRVIERIKKLLYDEGYTIAGAKKRLEGELKGDGAAPPPEPASAASRPARPRVAAPVPVPPAPVPPPLGDIASFELAAPGNSVDDVAISPEPASEARPRRRVRLTVAPEPSAPAPALFETEASAPSESLAAPVPSARRDPDARLRQVASELREILELLSRDGD